MITLFILLFQANLDSMEMSVGVKWENYLVTHKNREFQKTVRNIITDLFM